MLLMTASMGTSHKLDTLRFSDVEIGRSLRHTMTSG
jgi:hypothetical protein